MTVANGIRRDLILVDERPDDIDVAEFPLGDFERIHALCLAKLKLDEGEEPLLTQAFGEACKQLASAQLALDRRHPYHELRLNLSEPLIAGLRGLAESSRKCSTLAAGADFGPDDIRLAAKLIVAANETPGFAFVALRTDFSHGAKFIVYAPNWRLRPATVLLDATSDIDGYAELSSVRVQEAVPEANYTQLEARLLKGPSYLTSYSPKDLWECKDTRTPLLKWMHKCVLQTTQAGGKVLLVTWKSVIEGGQLQLLRASNSPRRMPVAMAKRMMSANSLLRVFWRPCASFWASSAVSLRERALALCGFLTSSMGLRGRGTPQSFRATSKQCCNMASSRRTLEGEICLTRSSRNNAMRAVVSLSKVVSAMPRARIARRRYPSEAQPFFVGETSAS